MIAIMMNSSKIIYIFNNRIILFLQCMENVLTKFRFQTTMMINNNLISNRLEEKKKKKRKRTKRKRKRKMIIKKNIKIMLKIIIIY